MLTDFQQRVARWRGLAVGVLRKYTKITRIDFDPLSLLTRRLSPLRNNRRTRAYWSVLQAGAEPPEDFAVMAAAHIIQLIDALNAQSTSRNVLEIQVHVEKMRFRDRHVWMGRRRQQIQSEEIQPLIPANIQGTQLCRSPRHVATLLA